jgi:uncharacterized protein (DUF934 family)
MPLIRGGKQVEDSWARASETSELPESGAVIVTLELWQERRVDLIARGEPLGVRLRSDQHADEIADDLEHFQLIELEFPVFRDGRAYSTARLLRRQGYAGELRAVGDVLLEQLHYMDRVGFDAFEIDSQHAVDDWVTACKDLTVWYQPSGDGRETALQHRRGH